MSKLKLWKPFSLFMVLLLMSSLVAVVPARPVQANVSSITVTPYDTRIIGLPTGYRITMTTGASLNAGDNITIEFPAGTGGLAGINTSNSFINATASQGVVSLDGQKVTVTIPDIAPIVPEQQFTVTFNKACNITNPPAPSGSKTVTVWTTVEPIHVTSSSYEITAVKVFTGATKHSENATIQGAIDAAISGDTITVPAGTFTENVNVNKSLTLQGASSATTIVTAANASDYVFDVTASSVIISGFTATGATGTGTGAYSGINLQTSNRNCNIHDNILTGNEYGILLIEPAGPPLTTVPGNNIFTNNTASGNKISGIEMQHSYGNTFTNNIANSNGSQGFKLDAARSNTFTGNTANLNGTPGTGSRCGFFLVADNGGCNDNIFTNNTANSNIERDGFRLRGSNHNTFTNNTANSNGRAGIRLDFNCDNTVLTGNNFTSNTQYGIQIDDDGTTPVIDATTLTVSGNNIAGNTLFGINYDNSGGTLNAKHNYWGHASGPSHDSPVTYGDKVSANVNFRPWLVNTYTGTAPATEITITTASPLPDGSTGVAYSTPLAASGGSGPYTWAYYSGTMPTGLSCVGSNLSGTPTEVNPFTFALQVKDGTQGTYKDFAMQVYGGNLVVTTTSPLPNGTKNVPYGPVQLQATGGTGTYTWSLDVGSGPLPTGLGLASDGKISGTPTAGGPFNFKVKVTCGTLTPGTKDLSITISAPSVGGQKLIGADDATVTGPAGAGYVVIGKFTASASDNVTQFRIKCSGPGNVKVAIYSDSSGEPGNLLNAVNTGTAVTTGWNTISFPATNVVVSTPYWLAFNSDVPVVGYAGLTGTARYKAATYSTFTFPSSAGTGFATSTANLLLAGWAAVTVSAPTVTNASGESDVKQTSARLNGVVTAIGGENPTVLIYWGDNDGGVAPYAWDNSVNLGTKGAAVPFYTDITGLNAGTDYWYRCFAANSGGSAWASSSEPFRTLDLGAPTVTNSAASSVTATSARLNGAITGTGGQDPTVIIYWGDNDGTTNLYAWDNSVNLGTKGAVPFYTDIIDLTLSTKYYYRGFASNSSGSAWAGSSENFTTLSGGVEQKFIGADDAVAGGPAGANYLLMDRFAAVASGDVSQIRVKCTTAGSVKVALYTDNAGSPGTLINANNTGVSVVAGWNNITIPSTAVTMSTNYWIAYNSSPACVGYTPSAGGAILFRAFTYTTDFPGSAGSGFATSSGYHSLVAGWGGGGVVLAPPGSPTLVTPKTTITFEWIATNGATKYRLQVNTASDFTGTVMFDNSAISTTSQQVALTVGNTYYWRVKAGNSGGWSGWSSVGSVTP